MNRRIVVVGGGLGGLRAAEQLRIRGWSEELVLVGAEPYRPYQRPPLSKDVLVNPDVRGLAPADLLARPNIALRTRPAVDDVTWTTGTAVVAVSLADRDVVLDDGTRLGFDGLVVATGLRPRRLALRGFAADRHVVRTIEDAVGLRARLTPGSRVTVAGGGFIGCEVASGAAALGCRVTVVEPTPAPMLRPLGAQLARGVQCLHERRGVRFRLERTVSALVGSATHDALGAVALDDGTELVTDVLVEAVGSVPNVEWLGGNGLDLSDGVLCDNEMRVVGADAVVAVGDVARFPNPRFDDVPRRVEHWSVPTDTAGRAATTLLRDLGRCLDATTEAFMPLPTFWSDQFDLRLQGCGSATTADRTDVVDGQLTPGWEERGVTVAHLRDGRVVGSVVAGGTAANRMRGRQLVLGPAG